MNLRINSRDIKFFALGVLSFFMISVIYDWEDNVKAFKEGYEAASNDWDERP